MQCVSHWWRVVCSFSHVGGILCCVYHTGGILCIVYHSGGVLGNPEVHHSPKALCLVFSHARHILLHIFKYCHMSHAFIYLL